MEDDELILHKFGQKLQQLRKNQSLTLQELIFQSMNPAV